MADPDERGGPKYAPADGDGRKPYVVTMNDWGKTKERLVYADDPTDARWQAKGRGHVGLYVTSTKRATPADVERLDAY
jgi:hypothetical protein